MFIKVLCRVFLIVAFLGGTYLVFNNQLTKGAINAIPLRFVVASNHSKVAVVTAYSTNGKTYSGAGFVYDGVRGYIVTAAHIVDNSNQVIVVLPDGVKRLADIVGVVDSVDVALLKVYTYDALPQVTMGDSDAVFKGDTVFTMGHPRIGDYMITSGIVSTRSGHLLVTDLDINPGNSGGPLFSSDGRVIGLVSSMYPHSGISNSISSNAIIKAVRDIIDSRSNNNP